MPSTSTNSYSFNTTDFTITQCHHQTLKMKSFQKFSPPSLPGERGGMVHFDASP